MKALSVSFGACIALFAATSAQPSVLTVGNSLAKTCYDAAEARLADRHSLATCDRALTEEALTADDRVATLVNRGTLHLVNRSYAIADRDFDAAIALKPAEPEAYLNKAILRVQLKDSASAFSLVDRAIQLQTRKPALAYFVRGLANEDTGNVKAAYADLVRARELAPDWADPNLELQRYRVR